ncbi:MAG: alpha/beta fold hydrolase, partial [Alphaproteobacteria bacterium]|nr:alpha/beta fold hydrolase [Alphaproteobacteria bacterium]
MAAEGIHRRYLPVGKRLVHYRRAGRGSPVVLLHETPMNSSAYVGLMTKLAGRFTVFAFDTPGFGDSEGLGAGRIDAAVMADALALTFGALNLPPCPVYGLDTGAAIALAFALRHPKRTRGLVLTGVPIFDRAMRRELLRLYTPR